MSNKNNAFIQVFSAIFIWSLLGPVLNLSPLTAFQNIWISGLLAVAILILYAIGAKKLTDFKKIRFNLPFFLFILTSGISGVLWLFSLTIMPIAAAVVLYTTAPIFTYILSIVFLKDKIRSITILAILLGILGIFITVSNKFGAAVSMLGVITVLSATLLDAGQAVVLKKFSISYPTWLLIFLIMISQVIVTTPLIFSNFNFNLSAIMGIVFLAIFSSITAFFLYVNGFKFLRPTSVILATYIEPFLAALWGFLWLNQGISLATLLGGLLIITSGYLTIKGEKA